MKPPIIVGYFIAKAVELLHDQMYNRNETIWYLDKSHQH